MAFYSAPFFPPDAVAGVGPAAGDVFEDGLGGYEEARCFVQVVDIKPGECPPSFVVIVLVQEPRGIVAARREGCFREPS